MEEADPSEGVPESEELGVEPGVPVCVKLGVPVCVKLDVPVCVELSVPVCVEVDEAAEPVAEVVGEVVADRGVVVWLGVLDVDADGTLTTKAAISAALSARL